MTISQRLYKRPERGILCQASLSRSLQILGVGRGGQRRTECHQTIPGVGSFEVLRVRELNRSHVERINSFNRL